VRKAVGGMWTNAREGRVLLYLMVREVEVERNQDEIDGVTQFGIVSASEGN